LAAAHAEAGDFKQAIKWQTRAIDLAPEDKKEECRKRLNLYKAGCRGRDRGSRAT
jgi:hypothetical protein